LELRNGFRHVDILDIADAGLQRDRGFVMLGIQSFQPRGGGAEDADMVVDILGGGIEGGAGGGQQRLEIVERGGVGRVVS
jgi:hypothetical protein